MVGSSDGKMIVNYGKGPVVLLFAFLDIWKKGIDYNFLFFGGLPVPTHAAGVVGTLYCCSFYIILVF